MDASRSTVIREIEVDQTSKSKLLPHSYPSLPSPHSQLLCLGKMIITITIPLYSISQLRYPRCMHDYQNKGNNSNNIKHGISGVSMAQVQWWPMSRLVEEGACNTKENKVKWGLEGGGAW